MAFACVSVGLVAVSGCGPLELIAAGECGNKVLEPDAGEDCDGEPSCHPPGEPGACRFRCTPAAGPLADAAAPLECPSGFGCGLDGVCRRASGHFALADERASAPTHGLAVGDLDADGRADVVRTTLDTTFVEQYDEALALSAEQSFFRAPDLIAVGDLTGDGLDDLAFRVVRGEGVAAGLAIMRAQPDRTLAGSIYAALPDMHTTQGVGVTVNAVEPFTEDELVIFLDEFTIGGTPVPLCPDNPTTISGIPNELDAAFLSCSDVKVEDIAGVLAANFIEHPLLSPCDEVAFAGVGAAEVWVLTPCELHQSGLDWSWGSYAEPWPVALQGGTVLDLAEPAAPAALRDRSRSLHAGDLDGDGHLDLLITTELPAASGQPALHVAYGLGNGNFSSQSGGPVDMIAAPLPLDYDTTACTGSVGALLDVGDVNADGISDLVTEHALLVSQPSGAAHAWHAALCGLDLARAALADFNGTGRLDVLSMRRGDGGVDFYAGAGDGTFSHRVVATDLPADRLVTGDFDGDLLADAAFVRLAPGGGAGGSGAGGGASGAGGSGAGGSGAGGGGSAASERDEVFVSFGQPWTAPSTPRSVGEISGVEQVLTGRHEGADSTSDILLVVRQEHLGIAVVSGDGSRQLWGPFVFPVSKDNRPVITSLDALAYGKFDTDAALGFAAITHDDPALGGFERAWRLRASGEADLQATRAAESMGETALACNDCRLVAVDLDGDGVDEAVSLESGRISVFAVVDGELEKASETPSDMVLGPALGGPTLVEPRAGDLDLDGLREVLLIDAAGSLWVLWNDGSGELDPAAATEVTNPLGDGEPLVDFALLQADDDPLPELVLLDAKGLLSRLDPEPEGRVLAPPAEGARLAIAGVGLALPATVLAAGDLDGDGVDDLVVGGSAGYGLLRGLGVRP